MNLTEHFTLKELMVTDHREFDNTPDADVIANLTRLAMFLEKVKTVVGGRPVMVTSGYRSKQVNDAVGSKDTSQHRLGCAADFRVPGWTPNDIVEAIIDSGLPYDQLIREFNSWVHVSIPNHPGLFPRRQVLIIDKTGTRPFA